MSAHAFCDGDNSSAFNGAKRVMSSARLAGADAISAAIAMVASHFFIVSLPDFVDDRHIIILPDYSYGDFVQWAIPLHGAAISTPFEILLQRSHSEPSFSVVLLKVLLEVLACPQFRYC